MKTLLFLIFSFSLSISYAGVFSWKDENGVVHFSDAPIEGAKEVELKQLPTVHMRPVPKTGTPAKYSSTLKDGIYTTFSILKPADGEAIRSNNGQLTVTWLLTPHIRSGHQQFIVLDGTGQPVQGSTKIFNNLDRGGHSVSVVIKDKTGNIIKSSNAVSFFVLRVSK